MKPIKAIIFDWGGVISPGGTPDEVPLHFAEKVAISQQQANQFLSFGLGKLKRKQINLDQFWAYVEQEIGRPIPAENRNIWNDVSSFTPDKDLFEYIQQLKKQNLIVGILSNVYPFTAEAIKLQGWYEGFWPLILSCRVGLAKPDREIYQLLLEQLELPASQIVFVDDQTKCLTPAQALGMQTIQARSPSQIIQDISVLLQ